MGGVRRVGGLWMGAGEVVVRSGERWGKLRCNFRHLGSEQSCSYTSFRRRGGLGREGGGVVVNESSCAPLSVSLSGCQAAWEQGAVGETHAGEVMCVPPSHVH